MNTTENVRVSVIMPIYNAYDYLRPALDSVIDQTFRDIEIICVDDGSTDHSLEIIKEYRDRDSRVRIITENNAGPSIARNRGLSRARGEYVIFLDADDFYEPTLIERLYEIAEKDGLDIAFCGYDIYNSRTARFEPGVKSDNADIFEGGRVVSRREYPDKILSSVPGYVCHKMFSHTFLTEKNLTFNKDIRVFEDMHFVVCAMAMADRVGSVRDCLVHHRIYSAQTKSRLFRKYYNQVPALYANIKEFLRANGMYIPLSKSFLSLSAGRCYTIYNILWRDAKENFWNLIHEEYLEELGWTEIEPMDIDSEEVRNFVTNILVFNHDQYQRRIKRGLFKRPGGVERAVKLAKSRKKFREIFKIFFKKKKKD